jgi:hypothetical protein
MNARRAIAVAAAGGLAAATAVIGAGAASAVSARPFCVNNTSICAFPNGGSVIGMHEDSQGSNPLWLFNGVNHDGQIQQNGTGLCMQLDHDGGNIVIEAACNKASYQEWDPYVLDGYVVYESEWNGDGAQCLTYNSDHNRLDTVACTDAWYQNFPGTT